MPCWIMFKEKSFSELFCFDNKNLIKSLGTDNITLYKKYVAKLVIHYTGKCHKVLSFEYIEFRNNAEQ